MGTSMIIILFSVVIFIAKTESSPAFKFEVCDQHAKDADECNRELVQTVLRKFKNGDKDLDIPPFDPLMVPELDISHGSGPNKFKLEITEGKIAGISDMHVSSVKLSTEDHSFEISGHLQQLTMTGTYKMSGDFIGTPTNGHGDCSVKFVNIGIKLSYRGNLIKKGCHQFLHITDFKLEATPLGMISEYTNLYEGDKEMAKSTVDLLNQFDQEVLIMLGPSINQELSKLAWPLFQKLHDVWAYDDMFPELKVPCTEEAS